MDKRSWRHRTAVARQPRNRRTLAIEPLVSLMKTQQWTSLTLVTGLVLMLVGPLAVSLWMPEESVWSDEDARRLSQASAELHAAIHANLAHSDAHTHEQVNAGKVNVPKKVVPDLAAAQRAYDLEQARLDRALSRRNWLWYGASVAGALIAAMGVAGHFLAGRSS